MLLEHKWHYDQWPPTDEHVVVLFDTSPVSSVSNFPRLYSGKVKRLERGIGFFPDGENHPLHPHFVPVAWRLR